MEPPTVGDNASPLSDLRLMTPLALFGKSMQEIEPGLWLGK
jgi:hypothetical protein